MRRYFHFHSWRFIDLPNKTNNTTQPKRNDNGNNKITLIGWVVRFLIAYAVFIVVAAINHLTHG